MSGIVRTSTYDSAGYNLAVSWSVQSQSIKNNSTTLSYRVFSDNNGYSTTWVAYYQSSVTINGTTVYSNSSRVKGYKNQTLKTGTITIPHNSDGSKSINISLKTNMYYSNSNTKTGSKTITLPTINRGIYDVSLPSGWTDLDGPKTITFKKYNSNTIVKVKWEYWSNASNSKKGEYIVRDTNGNSLADNYTSGTSFKFQEAFINAMHDDKPNYKTATVYITIRAYAGSNLIQTIKRKVNLKLKVEAPSLSITTKLTGFNQRLLGSSKRGLVGIHALEISSSVKAKNGANISRVELTFDDRKYSNKTGNFKVYPKKVGSRKISVKAVDTRGYQYIVKDSVTILNYKKPYVTHRAYRHDGSKESPVGATGRISGTVHIYDVKNTNGESVNKPYYTLSLESTLRNSSSIFYSMSLPISQSRKYEIKGEDRFSVSKTSGEIPVGEAPLVLGKDSVGIGAVPPENGKGLWMQDSLLNGKSILTYPHYSGFTGGDFENMAERIRKNAENDSLNYATLTSTTTGGYAVLYVFSNKARAVGTIDLYGWGIRRVEYKDGNWTVKY